jgi:aminoglycoside phosphotransferase (APT) family kinase protein
MSEDVQNCLQAYCEQAFRTRQGIEVKDLSSITAGWENQMFSFDVEYGPAEERQREGWVLRMYPGENAYARSGHEFHGMKRLYEVGYPVPRVLLLEREHSPFGRPFVIMERIEGGVLWPLLFGSPEEKQQELLRLFCELFVQLHTLDWRPFVDDVAPLEDGGSYVFVDQWLHTAHDALDRFPMKGFLPVVRWLEERRDELPCRRPSVVHWDFHPFNILLRADGSAVVIDWSGLQVSDFRFDLGWTLVLAHSYVGVEWRDRILEGYEGLVGGRVQGIECFEMFACARRLFDVTVSLSEGAEKLGMRPDAVQMMEQQIGAFGRVYDLLLHRTGIRVEEVEQQLSRFS